MKLTRIISAIMVATTLGGAVNVVTPDVTAQAATKKTILKSYPKSMRKTWYRYEKNSKGKKTYTTEKITAKKWVTSSYFTGKRFKKTQSLHYFNVNKGNPKVTKKNMEWLYGFKSNGLIKFNVWVIFMDENANPFTSGYGTNVKVMTKTYQGKKIKVLKYIDYSTTPYDVAYSYTSKSLAKHFNPKGTTSFTSSK